MEIKKLYHITLISVFFVIILNSCYKEVEFNEEIIEYEHYARIVGPDGGIVNFMSNYANDKKRNMLATLSFPSGAIDSFIVLNIYQHEDYDVSMQLEEGFAYTGSKFMYFIPFYKSQGYNEQGVNDPEARLSLKFKKPVSVKYYYLAEEVELSGTNYQKTELYYEYYKKSSLSYKLYRIKIPDIDEWGSSNNIYINWNQQGYPDGYNKTDLNYILTGSWFDGGGWGTENISLINWEEVKNFKHDVSERSISFEMYSTDYVYVLANIIQIDESRLPYKIRNYLSNNYPNINVLRASFDRDQGFTLFMSNGAKIYFDSDFDFEYIETFVKSSDDLPSQINDYITTNYPTANIKTIKLIVDSFNNGVFTIKLTNGVKLFFDLQGNFVGMYQSNYSVSDLPEGITDYIKSNFPGEPIINVIYDNEINAPMYLIYTINGFKFKFDHNGNWISTTNTRFKYENLPENIKENITSNYALDYLSSITFDENSEHKWYQINLINGIEIYYDFEGNQLSFYQPYLPEEELLTNIKQYIATNYPEESIVYTDYTKSSFIQNNYELYDVYITNDLNIEFDGNGEVIVMYGYNDKHLPMQLTEYLDNEFKEMNKTLYEFEGDGKGYFNLYFLNGVNMEFREGKLVYFSVDHYHDYNIVPSKIKDFFIENPVNETPKDVSFDFNEDLNGYVWTIEFSGQLEYYFDMGMNFIGFYDYQITKEELPTKIETYLQTYYSGVSIFAFSFYYDTDYKEMIYLIELNDANNTYIYFDEYFNFIDAYKKK